MGCLRTIVYLLRVFGVVGCVGFATFVNSVMADEMRPAYLQITQSKLNVFEVFWRVPAKGQDLRLNLDVRFGPDVHNILPFVEGFSAGSHSKRWSISRKQGLVGMSIAIDGLMVSRSEVLMRIEYLDSSTITERLTPYSSQFVVQEKPSWLATAWTYFVLGVEHILVGLDHLLFVFVLLLLVSDTRKLIFTVTAFTAAHSITLALSSLNVIRIPVPPIEACIALSIVLVAVEIVRNDQGKPGVASQRPWLLAFLFGLLHGLGFASALAQIGLPTNAIITGLVVFNLGVEVGQLIFVFAVLLVWKFITYFSNTLPLWQRKVPAYGTGAIASFWMFERVAGFWG